MPVLGGPEPEARQGCYPSEGKEEFMSIIRARRDDWPENPPHPRQSLDRRSGGSSCALRRGRRHHRTPAQRQWVAVPAQPLASTLVRRLQSLDGARTDGLLEIGVALLREHLFEVGDVRGRFIGRKVGARNGLGLLKAALQADDKRQILPNALVGAAVCCRAAQHLLGTLQVLR